MIGPSAIQGNFLLLHSKTSIFQPQIHDMDEKSSSFNTSRTQIIKSHYFPSNGSRRWEF